MKVATMARLDLLAAVREARLVGEIGHHNAALARIAQQRGVLAAYRDRLGQSWRAGGVVDAAFARRAGRFVDASRAAEAQIDRFAEQARRQLEAAVQKLAEVRSRRRMLDQGRLAAERTAERTSESRAALAQPWAPKPGRQGRDV